MKLTLCIVIFSCLLTNLQAQTFHFVDQTNLLPSSTFHSGNAIGVCDMNGDGKNDIVRASGNSTLYIDYQTSPDSVFAETSFASINIGDPWAMCIGDVDNNGYNDMIWGDYGNVFLLIANSNGTDYTDININSTTSSPFIFSMHANFADINNDSYADVFVCNSVAMSHIYVNGGGSGTWTMNQALMPLATEPATNNSGNNSSIWTDLNDDNWLDLLITHNRQGVPNAADARRIDQIFINNGNTTYTQDVTNWTSLRDGGQGWSTAPGDIDNDGDMDLFVLNYDVNSKLQINDGTGVFTNAISGSGINNTTVFFGMNAQFHDFDNDGLLDLMISGDQHYLYRNNGNSTFTQISNPFVYGSNTITAFATGDLNDDGFLDIYSSYCDVYNSPSVRNDKLWMNNALSFGNTNHYVFFDLVGGASTGYSNLNGIGAIIKIYGSWGVQVREVRSGEGWGIQNSFSQHFGLGSNTSIDSVSIHWPSGIVTFINSSLAADRHYTIYEQCGAVTMNATASIVGMTLTCDTVGNSYQWIDCNTNLPIAGETGQSYTATSDGSYAVILIQNGCSDTSACITINTAGIQSANVNEEIRIYPNPNNGHFFLETKNFAPDAEIKITDILGKVVYENVLLNVKTSEIEFQGSAGVYTLTIADYKNNKVFKLIKE